MPDFSIDPELRVRVNPPVVLRRTTEAVAVPSKDGAEQHRPRLERPAAGL